MKTIVLAFENTLQVYRSVNNEQIARANTSLIKLIKQWVMSGHSIHIISNRKPEASEDIEIFIANHDLAIKQIHYTTTKTKLDISQELKADLYIDEDHEATCQAMLHNINTMLVPIDEYNVKDEEK